MGPNPIGSKINGQSPSSWKDATYTNKSFSTIFKKHDGTTVTTENKILHRLTASEL